MKFHKTEETGFTIVELIVVITIITVLVAVVLVEVFYVIPNARNARRMAEVRQLETALRGYYIDHGDYPMGEDDTGPAGFGIDFSDTSLEGNSNLFIHQLVDEGYMGGSPQDPGNYLFYVYVYENESTMNKTWRTLPCGDNPEARAVLVFFLEGGTNFSFDNFSDFFDEGNAICFYP